MECYYQWTCYPWPCNQVYSLFSRMLDIGIKPSDVNYIGVLVVCSHGGKVNKGKMFFDHTITVARFKSRIEHYGCMIDFRGRNGLLHEIVKFIADMLVKHDAIIWKVLLGVCKMHEDIKWED